MATLRLSFTNFTWTILEYFVTCYCYFSRLEEKTVDLLNLFKINKKNIRTRTVNFSLVSLMAFLNAVANRLSLPR